MKREKTVSPRTPPTAGCGEARGRTSRLCLSTADTPRDIGRPTQRVCGTHRERAGTTVLELAGRKIASEKGIVVQFACSHVQGCGYSRTVPLPSVARRFLRRPQFAV